ncbi:myb-like protein U isoform X2 [Lucilia sericata]|uniref:myb-like protein U isoform X2 n=1 Tax=Lucilia sericata TaxID=13632 RepID=UPI0018A802B3|nr:myb-like protein U isoform X2 [Lucilia sericata]
MSDRVGISSSAGRYARVSPSPGRGTKVAYAPCPLFDAQDVELGGNCLAIPMSSLQPPPPSSAAAAQAVAYGKTSIANGNSNNNSHHYKKERCSGFTGACTQISTTAATTLPLPTMQHELDVPQPLVDRKPSVSLLRWNNANNSSNINNNNISTSAHIINYNNSSNNMNLNSNVYNSSQQIYTPNSSSFRKQSDTKGGYASFATGGGGGAAAGGANNGLTVSCSRSEPISLATLDRDCFIIPVHSVDRFLPAGIPLPPSPVEGNSTKPASPLSVLEVSDPKMCILVHLMSPLEPIDPVLESPLAHPLLKQRAVASELLQEVQQANTAVGGMLLANMEKCSEFPFIAYYVINTTQTDPSNFYTGIRVSSLSKFEPKNLKYTAAHTLDLYSEVAAICRPPLTLAPNESGSFKKSQTPATGYIISVFKVFEGDDGERFEKNWLYWTGARMLYRYLPRAAGLRRISLHKSTSQKGDKMYLLVCECAELLKDITSAAVLIPALRARLCGYTGLYRPIQAF